MKTFYTLVNSIQSYAWGSKSGISAFTGIANPEGKPMAELWMGAHPASPSKIRDGAELLSLKDFIASDPEKTLGPRAASDCDGKLPYLFKVLSAGAPLSLQVHPSRAQAVEGFARENGAGIPVSSPERNYKDDNHKPEIIMALTPFTAMCGFRVPGETRELLSLVQSPHLLHALSILEKKGSYTEFCRAILELSTEAKKDVIAAMSERAPLIAESTERKPFKRAFALAEKLIQYYPADIGILSPLYLNVVDLLPEQAIYLPAGVMHAYIDGTGLELMANSDNVLRGGLTPKHIDVPELLSILDPAPFMPEIIRAPGSASGIFAYPTESREFELSRLHGGGSAIDMKSSMPAILIGAEGSLTVSDDSEEKETISKGVTLFLPASGKNLSFTGTGTAYIASIPGR
jgi:mannose-6-phosphate isomerase